VGCFRTGKSFLLNHLVNYLRESIDENSSAPFEKINATFEWSYGSNAHTKGAWMWIEPFIIKSKSGKQLAVFIMDTQGTFDTKGTPNQCASIFSLSALLSSIQIYNIKANIEKTHLEYLSLFAQYKQVVEKTLNCTNNKSKAFKFDVKAK
jgi:atlastin